MIDKNSLLSETTCDLAFLSRNTNARYHFLRAIIKDPWVWTDALETKGHKLGGGDAAGNGLPFFSVHMDKGHAINSRVCSMCCVCCSVSNHERINGNIGFRNGKNKPLLCKH